MPSLPSRFPVKKVNFRLNYLHAVDKFPFRTEGVKNERLFSFFLDKGMHQNIPFTVNQKRTVGRFILRKFRVFNDEIWRPFLNRLSVKESNTFQMILLIFLRYFDWLERMLD